MTVNELLNILKNCPQDAEVLFESTGFDGAIEAVDYTTIKVISGKVGSVNNERLLPEKEHLILSTYPII